MSFPAAPKMVNYFPVNNGGYSMWSAANYNGNQIQDDIGNRALPLGVDTVRQPIPALNGYFDFNTPTDAELSRLNDYCTRMNELNVFQRLCLFDGWRSYGFPGSSQTYAARILSAIPDLSKAQIEWQNEQTFGATTTTYNDDNVGYGGGWTAATNLNDGQIQTTWVTLMINWLKANYPAITSVVSAGHGGPYISNMKTFLQSIYNSLHGTAAAPSKYEWHGYVPAGSEYSYLQSVLLAVGSDPTNVFIGEYGLGSNALQSGPEAEQAQADYMKAFRSACQWLGIAEPAPWILNDINPCPQFPNGQQFGLYDVNGNIKPAGQLYIEEPMGSRPYLSPAGVNPAGNGAQVYGSGRLPLRWSPVPGSDGSQAITAVLDPSNPYDGAPSTLLTGSGASTSAQYSTEVGAIWPTVAPGESYTFSAAIRGAGSVGSPRLNISWYSKTAFISGTSSTAALALTGSFQRFSLAATAPAGAVYARLSLNVPSNAGQIWFAGPLWAGRSARLTRPGVGHYR